jgi:hypothetical protein
MVNFIDLRQPTGNEPAQHTKQQSKTVSYNELGRSERILGHFATGELRAQHNAQVEQHHDESPEQIDKGSDEDRPRLQSRHMWPAHHRQLYGVRRVVVIRQATLTRCSTISC